jgi:hypothetical protein|tara:strand:+ start:649 stop:966 length:318 start_codon:yes stop_codon:yes gene_type:complete
MLDLIAKLMRMNSETRNLDNELVNSEVNYISSTLELMRDAQQISNDAYLDSGSIQGGLSVISSLLEQGISDSEIDSLLNTLFERAKILNSKYPKLNKLIESYRNN